MRRLRYNVACSLDGFIADPDGGYDWIVDDKGIDFDALYAQFDTFVMGRRTWEVMQAQGDANPLRGRRIDIPTEAGLPSLRRVKANSAARSPNDDTSRHAGHPRSRHAGRRGAAARCDRHVHRLPDQRRRAAAAGDGVPQAGAAPRRGHRPASGRSAACRWR